MTSAISGTDSSSIAILQQQLSQLQAQSAVGTGAAGTDSTGGGTSAGMSRLSQLFSSDGNNQAGNQLASLASSLGVDQSTLIAELQSGNSSGLADLMSLQALSATSATSPSDPLTAASSPESTDSSGLGVLGGSSSGTGNASSGSAIQTILAGLGRAGVQYNGQL